MTRNLPRLANARYDVAVVGGGIYGACVAWDASLRGLSVVLLEQGDIGSGTSANSLKIIHGGFNMLVLTRKAGEEIVIGDGIRVQVIEIRGGRVRLGITAPRSVPVHRSEVNINSNDTELVEVHCRAHRTG